MKTSLLTPTVRPQQSGPQPAMLAKTRASQVKSAPRRMAEQIVQQWERSFDLLWEEKDGVTSAMQLAEIGTYAAELFQTNSDLVTFLVTTLSGKDDDLVGRIMAKVATIPAYTIHEDGTVTLD